MDENIIAAVKLAVFAASFIAAVIGVILLLTVKNHRNRAILFYFYFYTLGIIFL